MKRFIGIDYGLKRTGIAVSDENNIIAYGLTTVETKNIMPFLKTLVHEKNIGVIVLGQPKRLTGADTHNSENVRKFYSVLQKQFPELEIVLEDERFTSKLAMQSLIIGGVSQKNRRKKELIDEVSATIILQSYMKKI